MNQQSRGSNSLSPGDLPMKRKRGRPRKEESSVQGESTHTVTRSDDLKKGKPSMGSGDDVDKMVGQVVSGVIEGSFDAGYLLNVKVGDTDTKMRGVVFLPGRFAPITAANDVAPYVRMYKRREVPFPTFNKQSQPPGSVHPEKSDKQLVEPKNQAPTSIDQHQPSESILSVALKHQPSTVVMPPADTMPKNDTDPSLSRTVNPLQIKESGPDSQLTPIMAQLECDKVVECIEVVQIIEASTLMKGPNEVEANEKLKAEPASEPLVDTLTNVEASKLMKEPKAVQVNEKSKEEPASEPVDLLPDIEVSEPDEVEAKIISEAEPASELVADILPRIETSTLVEGPNDEEANKESKVELTPPPVIDMFQGIEAVGKEPRIQLQGLSSDSSNNLVHDKTLNLELNQALLAAEPKSSHFEPDCKPVNNLQEKQGNEEDIPQETESGHALEVSNGEGKPVGEAINTTGVGSFSAGTHSEPAMMLEEETIPSESKLSSEGCLPPGLNEHQIRSPPGSVSIMDSEKKDFIPPSQP